MGRVAVGWDVEAADTRLAVKTIIKTIAVPVSSFFILSFP